MGWADCGPDSNGRPRGYAIAAICDHPGCGTKIHRGLDYACGGMHGEDDVSCEGYFCSEHRDYITHGPTGENRLVCIGCLNSDKGTE